MRVAQFSESYSPVINGAAVAVDLLAAQLTGRHEVHVFAPRFRGHRDPPAAGHVVHRFPSYCWPAHPDYPLAVPHSPALRARFRRERFDVVHTHSPFTLGQVGRRWARAEGVAVVTTYHTLYEEYAHYAPLVPRQAVRRWLRHISRRYCESVDGVAVPTEYGVTRPIHEIPTGLRLRPPVPPDPQYPRGELGIPADAPVMLYAGRLAREKNLELLFAAWARVAQELPAARFLVAGGGPEAETARRLAAGGPGGQRVHFAGFVPPERMPLVYAAADLFVFTSLTDTQGLVLTEAKAAGVPAVAVNAYGPGVVIRDGVDGLLTDNDPREFAAAVVRVLSDRGMREQLREGALREARRYSIEATAQAYEALYEEARAARRP
jgi:1,2-diacylglycerol 3-alpha-glucosyltransferase